MRSISFAATATATALAAATAGVGLLVTAPGAASADATRSSAYGIQVSGGGEVIVPPSPKVESSDGSTKTAGGGSLPANPLGVSASVAELSAGDDQASVELADLGLAPSAEQAPQELQDALQQLQDGCEALTEEVPPLEEEPGENEPAAPRGGELPLPPEFDPLEDLLTELLGGFERGDLEDFCDSFDASAPIVTVDVVDVSCTGDTGTVRIQDVTLLGQDVPLEPSNVEPNTAVVPENPLVTITANRQTTTDDDGFSVDGLAIELAGGEGEAIVANATCGETIATEASAPAPPAAPAPAPVSGSAPVTG